MEDDYEQLRMEFTLLPGIDLRLWLWLVSVLALIAAVAIALCVTR